MLGELDSIEAHNLDSARSIRVPATNLWRGNIESIPFDKTDCLRVRQSATEERERLESVMPRHQIPSVP